MLNNHAYRKVWDENMIEGKVISMLTPVDEVGYYAAKAPSPISNRGECALYVKNILMLTHSLLSSNHTHVLYAYADFVTHRTFRAYTDQNKYIIFNKSTEHPDQPEDPNFVRGWSFRTGYQIKEHDRGCTLDYMTQSGNMRFMLCVFVCCRGFYLTLVPSLLFLFSFSFSPSDPRGWIPKWLTNSVTSKMAPSIIEKMTKAAQNYEKWKV